MRRAFSFATFTIAVTLAAAPAAAGPISTFVSGGMIGTTSSTFPGCGFSEGPSTQLVLTGNGACGGSVGADGFVSVYTNAYVIAGYEIGAGVQISGQNLPSNGFGDGRFNSNGFWQAQSVGYFTDSLQFTAMPGAPVASSVEYFYFVEGGFSGHVTSVGAPVAGEGGGGGGLNVKLGHYDGFAFISQSTAWGWSGTPAASTVVPWAYINSYGGPLPLFVNLTVGAQVSEGLHYNPMNFSVLSDFNNTAGVERMVVRDALGNDISSFYTITSASGRNYLLPLTEPGDTTPVPEAGSLLTLGISLAALAAFRLRITVSH